jgi:diguanylate cyclase (GGDEF)-like protein
VPEPDVRRLPAALDARLARLQDSREELAKAWLLRMLERASLDQIERLPTDRIARELPALISEILRAVASAEPTDIEADNGLRERAARVGELHGGEDASATDVARDLATLQSVLIGALRRELQDREPHVFAEAVDRLAEVFCGIQAAAIDELVGRRERELERLANTDPLTGLYNVRFVQEQLRQLLDLHRRYGHPFAVLLLDIDGLKRLNDSRGHAEGDRALVAVAGAIRAAVRRVDAPARIGGDEFCVVAPQQTAARARVIADRIATAIASLEEQGFSIGISIGVASCPQHAVDAERLLELGDEAMYRAKAAGVAVAVAEGEQPPGAAENGY